MPATAIRTIGQIVTDHRAIIGQILDRELPASPTPTQFIELIEQAADFTGRLHGSYMAATAEDLGAVATYLANASSNAVSSTEQQVFLKRAHDLLHALDPNEFLY